MLRCWLRAIAAVVSPKAQLIADNPCLRSTARERDGS